MTTIYTLHDTGEAVIMRKPGDERLFSIPPEAVKLLKPYMKLFNDTPLDLDTQDD